MNNWSDGLTSYKSHEFTEFNDYIDYNLIIKGNINLTNIFEIFNEHLENTQLPIHVLYSGGIDSEFVCAVLKILKVPFTALSMKLLYKGILVNEQDVYYSEKYCRESDIKQKFVDLNLENFYETGEYAKFIIPYKIRSAYLASQFWLLTKSEGFNIIGGNYFWPQYEKLNPVLSPMSYGSNLHQKFMMDNNLRGIGNMLSHSYDSNYLLIKTHKIFSNYNLPVNELKKQVYDYLLGNNLELRKISHGWEKKSIFHIKKFDLDNFKTINCRISWDENLTGLLETNLSTNHIR